MPSSTAKKFFLQTLLVKDNISCMIPKEKADLLELLYRHSFKRSETPITLASGQQSHFYILKDGSLTSSGMELIGHLVYRAIKDLEASAIGGLAMGAVFIALPTAMVARKEGKELDVFLVRKELKGHGIPRLIEGPVKAGDKVVIVDDVMTTGGSVLKAIRVAKDSGLIVIKVVVLVDRQAGGREAVEGLGVPVEAIFTIDDFLRLDNEKQRKDKATPRERAVSRQSRKSNAVVQG